MVYAAKTVLLCGDLLAQEIAEPILREWAESVPQLHPLGEILVKPVLELEEIECEADPEWRVIWASAANTSLDGLDWELGRGLSYVHPRAMLGSPDRLMAGLLQIRGQCRRLMNLYPMPVDDLIPPRSIVVAKSIAQDPPSLFIDPLPPLDPNWMLPI